MKYLFILFLFGCGVQAQKIDKDIEFEELMKQLGVNFLLRKVGNTTKPNVNFKVEGDEWTFTTTSAIKSATIKFKLNQEIDEETMDGRKVKVILNTF
jgi:hypothetical protein